MNQDSSSRGLETKLVQDPKADVMDMEREKGSRLKHCMHGNKARQVLGKELQEDSAAAAMIIFVSKDHSQSTGQVILMGTKGRNCSEENFNRAVFDWTHEIHNPNTNVKHREDVELSGGTMTNDIATLVATNKEKQREIARSVKKLTEQEYTDDKVCDGSSKSDSASNSGDGYNDHDPFQWTPNSSDLTDDDVRYPSWYCCGKDSEEPENEDKVRPEEQVWNSVSEYQESIDVPGGTLRDSKEINVDEEIIEEVRYEETIQESEGIRDSQDKKRINLKDSSNPGGLEKLPSYNCDDMDQGSVAECPVVSPGYSYKFSDSDDTESSYQVDYECDSDGHKSPHKSAALCAYSGPKAKEVMEQLHSAPRESETMEVRVGAERWIVDNGISPSCSNTRDTGVAPNHYLKSLTVRSELDGEEYTGRERIQEKNLLTSEHELTDDDNWTTSSLSDFDVDHYVQDNSIPQKCNSTGADVKPKYNLKHLKKGSQMQVKKAEKTQKIHPSKDEYDSTDDEGWTVSSLSDWADEYDDGYDTSPWSSNMNLSHKSERGVNVKVMQVRYPIHSACKGGEYIKNGKEEQGRYSETHEISHVPGLLDQRRLIGANIEIELRLPSTSNAILKNEMQRERTEEGEPAQDDSFCPPVETRRKAKWKRAWAFVKSK